MNRRRTVGRILDHHIIPDDVRRRGRCLGHAMLTLPKIAGQLGLAADGFRVVLNTGKNGGQTVMHLHWHILGGRYMEWPPG